MTWLLDANLLIALVVREHIQHDSAETWLSGLDDKFATCPITQGSLLRLLIREGLIAERAIALLLGLSSDRRHVFWPDDVPFEEVRLSGVIGHRQVADAYLAQLARAHHGRLATFDQGLVGLHADVATAV